MLRITVPYVQSWNAWFADTANSPDGVTPLRARVDAACAEVGRDPEAIERSVAVLAQLPGSIGRRTGDTPEDEVVRPVQGTAEEMAAELRRYAAAGIAEVQLVVDPIDRASLERLAPVLELLDAR
jgi:alkanesulfonate monooxygenase SsuD/methylene tetrahydromethanopterin reductase-like flavin-dependent oxidoreductase (luciferase family)